MKIPLKIEHEDDVLIPRTPRLELLIPDSEMIDDLIDSLWRYGSAQDYPPPVLNQVRHTLGDPYTPTFREYTDLRSQTRDRHLDQCPVPGYRDYAKRYANIDFGENHAQHVSQTGKAHGRRRA